MSRSLPLSMMEKIRSSSASVVAFCAPAPPKLFRLERTRILSVVGVGGDEAVAGEAEARIGYLAREDVEGALGVGDGLHARVLAGADAERLGQKDAGHAQHRERQAHGDEQLD